MQYLNQYVVGQENAKKVLSVAYVSFIYLLLCQFNLPYPSVFNHYNRVRAIVDYLEPDGYGPAELDTNDSGHREFKRCGAE